MNRAEQLTRELYLIHKTDTNAVAYAVARIMALEELLRDVLEEDAALVIALDANLRDEIEKLVPDYDTFDNDDPDSTEEEIDADE